MSIPTRWTWTGGAVAVGMVLLVAQTLAVAQESAPPENGKALAERIGLTGDAAGELEPQLDELADALSKHAQIHEQAMEVRTELHTALTEVVPALTPEQRQQLHRVMMQSHAGFGMGMGHGMGPAMHGGMGFGMHGGMGHGMHRGMGHGTPGDCPFYPAPTGDRQPPGS